jgi:hypothetical protein
VRLRPGERVPLDGEIVAGQGSLNQAPITGESLPVDKGPGDPVYAGSINLGSALELRVTAPADDSLLARITHAVEQAQGARAPTQRFVDRFAAVYTPLVFVLALAVAVLGPVLAGWPLDGVYRALVLLVIACPCALVISTPVTVVSALAAAARQGVLIKGGRSWSRPASCGGGAGQDRHPDRGPAPPGGPGMAGAAPDAGLGRPGPGPGGPLRPPGVPGHRRGLPAAVAGTWWRWMPSRPRWAGRAGPHGRGRPCAWPTTAGSRSSGCAPPHWRPAWRCTSSRGAASRCW